MGLVMTARHLAEQTPVGRNRYVDLLRALSILVVVLGHWTMAAVTVRDGELSPGHLLVLAEWTHPLTWIFQVMPVFFLVGGYANALSWRSARRRGEGYGGWLRSRARRLTLPVVPVLLAWFAAGWLALALDAPWQTVRLASTVALVPTWFLAAYVLVVAAAPLTLRLWERWGWQSVAVGVAVAAGVDALSIMADSVAAGFVNYLVVWATVHQLGYAWLDGALAGRAMRVALLLAGLVGAVALVALGPYPVSMVGVDTAALNNTYPTRVTLLFLGMFQGGVALLLEPAGQRIVHMTRAWTVVVALNARIMTVYLWHVTAMVAVIGLSLAVGGPGLGVTPLTAAWWATRPLWWAVVGMATAVLVALLGRFETPQPDTRPPPAWWRPLLAVGLVCAGLGALAVVGIADADGLNGWLLAAPVAGVVVGGVLRPPGRRA